MFSCWDQTAVHSRSVSEGGFELGKKLDEKSLWVIGFEAGTGGWSSWYVMQQVRLDGLQSGWLWPWCLWNNLAFCCWWFLVFLWEMLKCMRLESYRLPGVAVEMFSVKGAENVCKVAFSWWSAELVTHISSHLAAKDLKYHFSRLSRLERGVSNNVGKVCWSFTPSVLLL